MEKELVTVGFSLIAIVVGSLQYSKSLISNINTNQQKCNSRIAQLTARNDKLKLLVRKYRASAEREMDFNQRLLKRLTLIEKPAKVNQTKIKTEKTNDRKPTHKP